MPIGRSASSPPAQHTPSPQATPARNSQPQQSSQSQGDSTPTSRGQQRETRPTGGAPTQGQNPPSSQGGGRRWGGPWASRSNNNPPPTGGQAQGGNSNAQGGRPGGSGWGGPWNSWGQNNNGGARGGPPNPWGNNNNPPNPWNSGPTPSQTNSAGGNPNNQPGTSAGSNNGAQASPTNSATPPSTQANSNTPTIQANPTPPAVDQTQMRMAQSPPQTGQVQSSSVQSPPVAAGVPTTGGNSNNPAPPQPGGPSRNEIHIPGSLDKFGARQQDNSPIDKDGNPHLVDPNTAIPIDFDKGSHTYNPRAAAFVAQQNALASGLSLDQAKQMGQRSMGYSSSTDPGTDGGTWQLANGPAKGVLYGASMIGAAAYLGYQTAQDQADVVAWPNVETGKTGETSGQRNFKQLPGTGVAQGGQGPVQITAPYHDRTGANNPAVSAVQAISAGEQIQGGHQPRVKDAIIPYNSGNKNDKVGQSEGARGSYADYMQTVVNQLKWFWQ